jgi:homocitrate synthase
MCPPVEEPTVNGSNGHAANGVNGTNGTNGSHPGYTAIQSQHNPHPHSSSPYKSTGDFLSNVSRFKIIESTLREGEQFAKYARLVVCPSPSAC